VIFRDRPHPRRKTKIRESFRSLDMHSRMAEQDDKHEHDDDEPDQAVTATAVVATAIAVIATPTAEKQNEYDDQ
jgi:hypothetical protein